MNTPSVGRVVHYYSGTKQLEWHRELAWVRDPRATFVGPFAATIVFVNEDRTVNLRVDFPTAVTSGVRSMTSEIVEQVGEFIEDADMRRVVECWIWPPRT